jgi:hypothetical protein
MSNVGDAAGDTIRDLDRVPKNGIRLSDGWSALDKLG